MNTHIRITPFDTCFFRDGRPFTSGEQTEAATLFPPFPSTVFGALRSAYIAEKGWDAFRNGELAGEIGTQADYQNASFALKGIFLEETQSGKIYMPLPYDLVVDKDDLKTEGSEVHTYPLQRQQVTSNSPLPHVLMNVNHPDKTIEYPSRGAYTQQRQLREYLLGQYHRVKAVMQERFFDFEPKVGIARNATTMTTEEGHLYQLNMIRLKQGSDRYHLVAEAEGITFSPSEGIVKLGGEQKVFAYRQSEGQPILGYNEAEKQQITETIRKAGGEFKLYFATPVLWNHADGWRANWMNLGNDTHAYTDEHTGKSVTCQLLTAALGKYQLVGGWDIMANRPKPMYRAVPAGTVYYLKLVAGEPEDVLELFHYHNLADIRDQEGFGLAYVGVVS